MAELILIVVMASIFMGPHDTYTWFEWNVLWILIAIASSLTDVSNIKELYKKFQDKLDKKDEVGA